MSTDAADTAAAAAAAAEPMQVDEDVVAVQADNKNNVDETADSGEAKGDDKSNDEVDDVEMTDSSEEDGSIEDDVDGSNDGDGDDKSPKEDPEILLVKAQTLKEEGNKFFTEEKDFEKAARSYRRGVNAIKKLNVANTGDEQVKSLLLSLQTNLSMVQFKLGKYKQSENVASNALQVDRFHVKALYRRAIARRKIGEPEAARDDLKLALKTEPNNTAVRKELVALKKELEDAKKAQKASLQRAFSKPGGGLSLYEDKAEEEKRNAELARQKKKEEEEASKKRKQEWEDECVRRMSKGEDAITFEDWDKERLDKIEAEKKEAEKKQKEEEKKRKAAQKKAREAAKKNDDGGGGDDDSDLELTESELAQMRGYKKTKDGRVTSYFTRETSEEEKKILAQQIAPKRLETGPQQITPSNASTDNDGKGKNASAWNHAGTWEERDTTDWCRSRLEQRLKETKSEAGAGRTSSSASLSCQVTEVNNITGDASVAMVGGKKRYIFDFHCKVEFEIKDDDTDDVIARGKLNLPDICSTHHEELEVDFNGWKKKPSSDMTQVANDFKSSIVSEVRESVKLWVVDFNEHY
mmetsp:Transcript_27982/g.67922  ORF Transcript_27982/g.67922 Transcript_27982/m.67922 type:complete len:580 (-) Transcript_27982:3412-5151(-)